MWLALALFPYLGPFITFCNFMLCFFGMERLFKAYLFLRVKWRQRNSKQTFNGFTEECLVGDQEWPKVTIQLPMYNERNVVERLIRSVAKTDYPLNKLQIQVLDDSTDETSDIVRHVIGTLPRNYPIEHIQRKIRSGYKAGALSDGLKTAIGEFIVVFDADFVPEADFVKKIVAPFFSDPKIGVVQGRWGFLNEDETLLTKLQSIAISNHFAYEQFTRYNCGLFLNFNGTCGAWRKTCIDDAGGWEPDTLAEDLDMSYRAQFRDWKIVYIQDIVVPGELPNTMDALKVQQYRWAKGGIQCFKKHVVRIVKSDRALFVKIMALIHLTGYTIYIPMFLLSFLPVLVMPFQATMIHPVFYLAGALGPSFVIALSQISLGNYKNLALIPLLLCLGYGLMLNNFYAVIDGLLFNHGSFKRTPKQGQGQGSSIKPYEVKKVPFHEIFFLCVSTYIILYGNTVNSFFYLTHLFYSLCYILMLYFSYVGLPEEEIEPSEKSHSHEQSNSKSKSYFNMNNAGKIIGQLTLLSFLLFLCGKTLIRLPQLTDRVPYVSQYYNPSVVNMVNGVAYPACTNFARLTEDNYLIMECYRRPGFRDSAKQVFQKYRHPILIEGEFVVASCYDKYQLLVKNKKNESRIERATRNNQVRLQSADDDSMDKPADLLVLLANSNYGDYHVDFEMTMKTIDEVSTNLKAQAFTFDNLKMNELDQQSNEISLVAGCGIVDDSDKKSSSFMNKQKDINSLTEYSHDSKSTMYCSKFNQAKPIGSTKSQKPTSSSSSSTSSSSSVSKSNFNENEDVFLWNRFQKNGYVTLYGDDRCPKRIPGNSNSYFNKRGGEPVDHSFGNYSCSKPLANRDACLRNDLYEPALLYVNQFWENYDQVGKMAVMKLNAEVRIESEIEASDKKLSDFITQFVTSQPNSIVTVVLGADTSKPKLTIIVPNDILQEYPNIQTHLSENQDRLVTLFDLYATFASIPHYPKDAPYLPSWSINLLNHIVPDTRNCNEARLSSTLCIEKK